MYISLHHNGIWGLNPGIKLFILWKRLLFECCWLFLQFHFMSVSFSCDETQILPYNELLKMIKEKAKLRHFDLIHNVCRLFATATRTCLEHISSTDTAYILRQFRDACDAVTCWLDRELPEKMCVDSDDGEVNLSAVEEHQVCNLRQIEFSWKDWVGYTLKRPLYCVNNTSWLFNLDVSSHITLFSIH